MLGITYSEFDNIVGPQLQYSYPPKVLSEDTFETLSDYAIVGSHLCNKSIVVKTEDIQFLSYSAIINQKKYHRNTLIFSCGVVLERDVDIEPYEPLLRKLSLALQSLELEQEFLFLKKTKDSRLPFILKDLYESVMTNGEAFVEIDPANYLAFKLFEAPVQPRKLGEYEVPMLLYDRELTASLPWDVSLQHVLPKINGISSIKNIAQESDMDIVTVSMALRILLFYRCIIMTSVFRFNNVYQLLPDAARRLLHDSSILQDMEEFALVVQDGDQSSGIGRSETKFEKDNRGNGLYSSSLGGAQSAGTPIVFDTNKLSAGCEASSADAPFGHCQGENGNDINRNSDAPSRIPGILRFLFRLRPGRTVAQAMFGEHFNMHATGQDAPRRRQVNLSKHLNNIDIRRLIAIAEEKNIVQRLYEFPIRAELAREREFGFGSVGADLASTAVPAPAPGDTASFYPYGDPSEDDYETVVDIADMAGSEIPGAKQSSSLQTNKGSAILKNRSSSGAPTDRSAGGERGVGKHRQTAPSKKRGASGGINKDNGSEEYLFIVDEDEASEAASDSDQNSSTSHSDSGSGSGTHDSDEGERTIDPDDVSQEWRKALRNEQQQLHRQQLIDNLHGAECLDEFCCVTELAPSEITKAHHMYIAYKASPLANNEKEK